MTNIFVLNSIAKAINVDTGTMYDVDLTQKNEAGLINIETALDWNDPQAIGEIDHADLIPFNQISEVDALTLIGIYAYLPEHKGYTHEFDVLVYLCSVNELQVKNIIRNYTTEKRYLLSEYLAAKMTYIDYDHFDEFTTYAEFIQTLL